MKPKAIVLLSGGLDSTTVLAMAIRDGFEVTTLSADYGQRHAAELGCAKRVATAFGVRHVVSRVDMFGGTALIPGGSEVPKAGASDGIPVTYVPARNTILLSLATALAEVIGAFDIFIGVNAVDYSGYPDCRPEYVEAFERMANLATKAAVEGLRLRLHAPLIALTKTQIIQAGIGMGVDYALTSSCYDPTPAGACGLCDSCRIRISGFVDAGVTDPITYRAPA
jgi:7-cyano-7-deazaguanine synthase